MAIPLFPRGIRRALRLPTSAERMSKELDDEIAFHLQQRIADLVARGMNEADARAEALRRFGDSDDLRAFCQSIEVSHMRRMRAQERWEGWIQDLRFALRQVRRSPGFFAIAAITLALGIGATTSIFSVVRGVLLRPLPYPEPDRIVQLWQLDKDGRSMQFSDGNFEDVRDQSRSFTALAQVGTAGIVAVPGVTEPVRARVARVSTAFFDVMGVRPLRGRLFAPDELKENGPVAVLVSHSLWQNALHGAENVVGQPISIDGTPVTLVGIMPPALDMPLKTDIWIPRETYRRLPSRTAHNWAVLGRLAPNVSVAGAKSDVSAIAKRLKRELGEDTWMTDATLLPLQEQLVGRTRGTLMILMAGSLILLLIACANVVNLLIARMAARQGEVAVRAALGAGRGRLIQQCLAESLMLGAAAVALGLLFARGGMQLLLALQPDNLPRIGEVRLDGHVLAFAIVVAVAASAVMGIIAAWRGTTGDLRGALAQSQRLGGGGVAGGERIRRALVVAQMAMAVVLLVATGLFAHSFARLLAVNPGFRIEHQVVVDLDHNGRDSERAQLYDGLLERFRGTPGVARAGGVSVMPLTPGPTGNGTFLILSSVNEKIEMKDFGRLIQNRSRIGDADYRVASPGFFEALGIPLIRGRLFDERDVATAPHVAVISNSLAQGRWRGEDPIGKIIQFGNMDGNLTPFTIVGIVGDVRETNLAARPLPTFYSSYRQRPGYASHFNFILATDRDPGGVMQAALRTVRELHPDMPPRARTIETIVWSSVADRRFVLSLVGAFGLSALVLAALGVYSVISYLVTQRGRELSIRVALGAKSEDILRLVVRQGVLLAGVGIVVGAVAALAGSRLIGSMLYGTSPTDPLAFLAVIAILVVVAALASWVPARRAARVQAMDVLRVG